MKTTLQVLSEARQNIADERNWAQFKRGGFLGGPSCALGAIDVAIGRLVEIDEAPVLSLARYARSIGFTNDRAGSIRNDGWLVANYNNTHSHAEVLALFDGAIEAERAKLRPTDITIFTDMLKVDAPVETASP